MRPSTAGRIQYLATHCEPSCKHLSVSGNQYVTQTVTRLREICRQNSNISQSLTSIEVDVQPPHGTVWRKLHSVNIGLSTFISGESIDKKGNVGHTFHEWSVHSTDMRYDGVRYNDSGTVHVGLIQAIFRMQQYQC